MKTQYATITRGISFALGILATIGGSAQAADVQYTFQEINVPGSTSTDAWGINAPGDVVGNYTVGPQTNLGFLLQRGVFTTINVPGSTYTAAFGINSAGVIVGEFGDMVTAHGFLLRNGKFTVLDYPGAIATVSPRINDKGDIIGGYFTADNPSVAHGFLLTRDGTFHTIAYPGAIESGGNGINSHGDIVGNWDNDLFFNFHGFLLTGGNFSSFDYPGAIGELGGSNPTGINASGQVCGVFSDADGSHGYVWENGVFTPIDAPAGALGTTGVLGLNDTGKLVGQYRNPTLAHRVGFIATPVR
jgi:probable HAF family extracellular repeat protein